MLNTYKKTKNKKQKTKKTSMLNKILNAMWVFKSRHKTFLKLEKKIPKNTSKHNVESLRGSLA
jgi:hypothetical protein